MPREPHTPKMYVHFLPILFDKGPAPIVPSSIPRDARLAEWIRKNSSRLHSIHWWFVTNIIHCPYPLMTSRSRWLGKVGMPLMSLTEKRNRIQYLNYMTDSWHLTNNIVVMMIHWNVVVLKTNMFDCLTSMFHLICVKKDLQRREILPLFHKYKLQS